MVDIQSATAEIRLGRKEEERKKQDKNIMSASATQGSHNDGSERLSLVIRVSAVFLSAL